MLTVNTHLQQCLLEGLRPAREYGDEPRLPIWRLEAAQHWAALRLRAALHALDLRGQVGVVGGHLRQRGGGWRVEGLNQCSAGCKLVVGARSLLVGWTSAGDGWRAPAAPCLMAGFVSQQMHMS